MDREQVIFFNLNRPLLVKQVYCLVANNKQK